MALGAVVAAALTDHSAHPYMLAVAGVDLVKQPGGGYGAPIEHVRLTQRGPGGVSELTFLVEDPAAVVGFGKGDYVLFRDVTHDYTLFAGFVVGWTPRPWQPGGRTIEVRCQGVETILDWSKVQGFTIPAGTGTSDAIQTAVGNVITGTAAPLRAFHRPGGFQEGEHDNPIGELYGATIDTSANLSIATGTTLREAIRRICDASTYGLWGSANQISGFQVTIDYDLGLRVFSDVASGSLRAPSDWGIFGVHTDLSNPVFIGAANFDYKIDATGPSSVLVSTASNAIVVSDGTGDPGDTATLDGGSLSTTAQLTSAGLSYLAQYQQSARGSFDVQDKSNAPTVWPGSKVTITAPEFGLASVEFRVGEIGRTFYGAKQDWAVTFGGLSPSFASLLRRLTRDTLS